MARKARARIAFTALLFASSLLFASEQPIELDTATGVIKGTLTTPAGVSKTPVVVMISGSGPTDRDGNTPAPSGRNDGLKLLASALESQGIASVRYDKRGVAASVKAARQESDLRIEDYVQDASAWVVKLAADARFSGVVILGHSEGSLIGMLAAQSSPIRGFISIAGPAEKAAVILRRQLQGRLPPDLVERNEAILSALEAGSTSGDVPSALAALYRPSVQPYLISWFKYSPAQELAKLKVPCLVVQGSTDIQVDVSAAQALHAARKLTPVQGKFVRAPLIKECLANIECKVIDVIEKHNIFVLEAVAAYIDPMRKERRAVHAVGDGTFIVDGRKMDRKKMMASKLPRGV